MLSKCEITDQNQSVLVSRMRLLRKRKWCAGVPLVVVTSLMEQHEPLLEIKTYNDHQKTFLLHISNRSNQIYDIYKHYFYLNMNKYKTSIGRFLRDLSQHDTAAHAQLPPVVCWQTWPMHTSVPPSPSGIKCNFAGFCRRCEVSGGFFMKLWIR